MIGEVPGCGRGYAVAALARCGYDATGLDIAPTAVQAANAHIARNEKVSTSREVTSFRNCKVSNRARFVFGVLVSLLQFNNYSHFEIVSISHSQ